MIRVPFLDLKAQHETIRRDVDEAIARVVASQQFILGPEVEAFERAIAEYTGMTHAIGVSSGTDALLATLMALGVGPGDEVVTTPFTFVATCSAIARLGARAVFVDIEPRSFNVGAATIDAAIGEKTKAVVPVHLFGQRAAWPERTGVPVVEDAAQAIGVRPSATAAAFSFFPSKNLGAFGDGGMVVTNDDALAARVRRLRNQGQETKYFAVEVGGNFRLDALQAAVLRAKLPYLDGWIAARRRKAERYRALFAQAGIGDQLVVPIDDRCHTWHAFVVRAKERDRLRAHLAERGIETAVYYPQPMHLQRAFAHWGYHPGEFPEAERAAAEALALPLYPELSDAMQEAVVGAVCDVYR